MAKDHSFHSSGSASGDDVCVPVSEDPSQGRLPLAGYCCTDSCFRFSCAGKTGGRRVFDDRSSPPVSEGYPLVRKKAGSAAEASSGSTGGAGRGGPVLRVLDPLSVKIYKQP